MHRRTGAALGIEDGDWVWAISRVARVKCQVKLMEGVNPDTVWTWNAIGKRSGAWNLANDAPESEKGFLLNHVISEFLPETGGPRRVNADPVTGQAAWYDCVCASKRPARRLKLLRTLPHCGIRPCRSPRISCATAPQSQARPRSNTMTSIPQPMPARRSSAW